MLDFWQYFGTHCAKSFIVKIDVMEMIREKKFERVGIVMIKPRIKDSICSSCHNINNCVLTDNKNGIYHCSEYSREQFLLKMDLSETTSYDAQNKSDDASGLCKSCDHRNSCAFREEGTVKFYCQHYQ